MVQMPSHRSIRENESEVGVFSLALPDVLINMSRVVIKSAIRPGIRSGGIEKLLMKQDAR